MMEKNYNRAICIYFIKKVSDSVEHSAGFRILGFNENDIIVKNTYDITTAIIWLKKGHRERLEKE